SLDVLIKFDNERKIFSGLEHNSKFDILMITVCERIPTSRVVFFAWKDASVLGELEKYWLAIDESYVRTVSPSSLSIPELRSPLDKDVIRKMYQNGSILPSKWKVYTEFHLTNDRRFFMNSGEMPVYQGSMIWLYDHRYNYYDEQLRKFIRGKLEDV